MSALCFVQWRRKVYEQCWPLLPIYVHRIYLKRDVARALCGTTISGWTWITWKLPQQLRDVLHISQLSFTQKYGQTYKSKWRTNCETFYDKKTAYKGFQKNGYVFFNSIESVTPVSFTKTHWCHRSPRCRSYQKVFFTFTQDVWQLQRLLSALLAYLHSLHSASSS